jgi:hypothetical protein
MSQDQAIDKIKNVIDYCKNLTLRLALLSEDLLSVRGVASGFIISREDDYYLISAGHALEKTGWIIETDLTVVDECITACIPVNWPWTLKSLVVGEREQKRIDFAWARINLNSLREAVQNDDRLKGKHFDLPIYVGPLGDSPRAGEPYCYASLNRAALVESLGTTLLARELSCEYLMEYKETRSSDGLYVFSVPEHKGHEYYEGASGSPIVAPSGKVVSVLLGGCKNKNELYGFPLARFIDLIAVSKHVEQIAAPDAQNTAPR